MQQKDKLTYLIRGAIFEVHKHLGPGLFEECYQQALVHELNSLGLKAESKKRLPVKYKGIEIKDSYEIDILVEDKVIIELKSVESLSKRHFKQLVNYLHLADLFIGYLVNFNVVYLEDKRDIFRIYNNEATDKTQH